MAGPVTTASCQVDEYQVTALAKFSLGTRFGVIACEAGLPNARPAPITATRQIDEPERRRAGDDGEGQRQHRGRADAEGNDDDPAAVVGVGHMAGDEREDSEGGEGGEARDAQRDGAAGQLVQIPADRDGPHLEGDSRQVAVGDPVAEIPEGEGGIGAARAGLFLNRHRL